MKAVIRLKRTNGTERLYSLQIVNNGNDVTLQIDVIDLMGAVKVAQMRNCKLITIYD